LLVEDDASTSNALRQLLTAYGYQVAVVGTVAAAVAAVDDSIYAVILDLMLPDGDGADVLRKIRAAGYKARVCITTGVSSPMWLDRVQALAPDCILQKPIDLAQLLEKL
jgi:DNA-binding response OmpR family regulator